MAVIILEAGFDDVGRRTALTVVMMLAEDGPLNQRPETFNRIRMDKTVSVGNSMIDGEVRNPIFHAVVAPVLISDENGFLGVHNAAQEGFEGFASNFVGRLGHDLTAACQCADDGLFLGAASTLRRVLIIVFAVTPRLAAYKRFVGLHNTPEKHLVVHHRLSDLHTHTPGSRLGKFEVTGKLVAGDTFLSVEVEGNSEEPFLEGDAGLLKYSAGENIKTTLAGMTVPAAYKLVFLLAGNLVAGAMRASRFVSPTRLFQMVDTGLLVRELLENLNDIHTPIIPANS